MSTATLSSISNSTQTPDARPVAALDPAEAPVAEPISIEDHDLRLPF
jgi:hypothetical protein